MSLNRKAFELAISTLILLILGILVLIGIVYAVTDGFKNFKSSSQPFLDTTQSSSVKQACELACQNSDKLSYCCNEYEINKQKIKCSDSRLEVSCGLSCQDYDCGPETLTEEQCIQKGGVSYPSPGDNSNVERCKNEGGTVIGNIPLGIEGSICCKK